MQNARVPWAGNALVVAATLTTIVSFVEELAIHINRDIIGPNICVKQSAFVDYIFISLNH